MVANREQVYDYYATVVRWVDGDTVILDVDLGFHVFVTLSFRLTDVNTPERGKEGFVESVQMVNKWAPEGSNVVVVSNKTGKFGRWLGTIYTHKNKKAAHEPASINEMLVAAGWPYVPKGK